MNSDWTFALQTIRYRSLIIEALLVRLQASDARAQQVINACCSSADVVEHIAQYTLESCQHNHYLIQDLKSALALLDTFQDELARSGLYVPSSDDINTLISKIEYRLNKAE
ncbi:hypothetical protein GL273_20680 [Aeromonas jandaei]|nr:hypothetical protein [Aeromonas jandaei]